MKKKNRKAPARAVKPVASPSSGAQRSLGFMSPLKPGVAELRPSPALAEWMSTTHCSLILTTYQTGFVILLGLDENRKPVFQSRTFDRPMGFAADESGIALATRYQLWMFRNVLQGRTDRAKYDALYVPRTSHVTGALDIHDVARESSGRYVFVNTLFSCLATIEPGYSFKPVWTPPWITKHLPEDRCHLNGLAVREGMVRYVTAACRGDSRESWRETRVGGGVLYDIVEDRAVVEGLTMPHSPRFHDGKLYYLNAGAGYLCRADPVTGESEEVCFLPGFARGLSLLGKYAAVGISDQRKERTFDGLPLGENLKRHNQKPRCTVLIIDLERGEPVAEVFVGGSVDELYDVVILPGVRRPGAMGLVGEDILYMIDIAPGDGTG